MFCVIRKDSIHKLVVDDSTKHDTARSRTFPNIYTTILSVFFKSQILEILSWWNKESWELISGIQL